ncbi:MAG: hypothetical protein LBB73_01980 [Dysgonamonadaceae bacterium]|jgi:hypothetical protein|nr:hypothetical protein [Dysgonamonadaceae bacterium]
MIDSAQYLPHDVSYADTEVIVLAEIMLHLYEMPVGTDTFIFYRTVHLIEMHIGWCEGT